VQILILLIMASRKFRLVPEDLYQKLMKDEPDLAMEFDIEHVNERERQEKEVQSILDKGQISDRLGYMITLYRHPCISWDKDFNLKYKDKKLGVQLFEALNFLNQPTSFKPTKDNELSILKLAKILYESEDLKSTFSFLDSKGRKYLFVHDSYWGVAEDYADKWKFFHD